MSIEIQKQIKDNSTSVQESFSELYKWTDEKGKAEKRRVTSKRVAQGLPVQVGAAKDNGSSSGRADGADAAKKDVPVPDRGGPQEEAIKRDKTPMANYYSSWDGYDADAQLGKIEGEAFEQQRTEREERQAAKDRILDEMALKPDGDRRRTSNARPRVKISVRRSGRRVAPVDLALPKKEEANRLFAEGRFREAMVTYTAGLDCLEKYEPPGAGGEAGPQGDGDAADGTGQETEALGLKTSLLANRALALLKLEEWREVVVDCTEALRFDPDHHKATLRRGFAFARLKRWPAAARDLQKAVTGDPRDTKAAAELQMARRMLAEQVKEARVHAKNTMRDPTREPRMPTRSLQVQLAQTSKPAASPAVPKPAAAANAAAARAAAAASTASSASLAAGTEAAAGGAASTESAAPRKPYVPRAVRMRGRQQAEPIPSARPAPGAGGGAESSGAPAMSFYVFEGQWARLRGKPRDRAALLRRIGAQALPALLRESLDSEILASVAEALAVELRAVGSEAAPFAAASLGALARTPRFDLSIRGLSPEERRVCGGVVSACAGAGQCGEEAVAALERAYAPPPPPAPREESDDEVAARKTAAAAAEPLASASLAADETVEQPAACGEASAAPVASGQPPEPQA
eukprot:CAMPEP_0171160138 /NCGR_PEP_ID=MMETSP0790-20130122/3400_1 /TAXON_ID=2925 /ORGANISM="Alexandrium catenella, Strain OF101" /LENGTH=634 /DNA_ID=CAMNT_0011624657 /DNA_START=66 /DNA_END=1967 /DNA_ORIENTATION=-